MYSLKESGEVYGGCSRTYMRTHMGARAILAGGDLYIPPHKAMLLGATRVHLKTSHLSLRTPREEERSRTQAEVL